MGSLALGGLIVLLASSNAHIVETRLGPLVVAAPHFVGLGVAYFLGFATAVVVVLGNALKRRKERQPGRAIVVKRPSP